MTKALRRFVRIIILCQYRDRRNGEYHIKQYCTLMHAFENVYIDVMHNHDDKHPAWSKSEISISVLIHIRIFIQRRNGGKSINE